MISILLVVNGIAPMEGINAIRWTKIAKYLKLIHKEDVKITVLTQKKNFDSSYSSVGTFKKDILLEKDMKYFDEYIDLPTDKWFSLANWCKRKVFGAKKQLVSGQEAMKKNTKMIIKHKIRTLYDNYTNIVIYRVLWNYIKNHIDEYDVVISSYSPMWPFMVAHKMKKNNKRLKWIADFRDVCGREGINVGGFAPWHRSYVQKHSSIANAVFRVEYFINTCTDKNVKCYTVTNGYDPDEAAAPECPDTFNFVYTGSIYGELQDFSIIYQAVNELIEQGCIQKDKVKVYYAGRYGEEAQIMANKTGITDFFVNLQQIPRFKARELQRKAAVLIQAGFNIENDYCAWTGKMYEYMISQKPIVYIVNGDKPNSFPSKYMNKLGGVCYEKTRHEETYPKLKNYIKEKYDEWIATGNVTIKQDREYVGNYSYQAIAEQVWEIIKTI